MKTDAKTMAEIYRHMADNLDGGLFVYDGIEILINGGEKWDIIDNDIYKMDFKNICYRIKPKTITLKNGVVIPKPLDEQNIDSGRDYYTPSPCKYMYDQKLSDELLEVEYPFVYHTQDEAIEASKALFGIK